MQEKNRVWCVVGAGPVGCQAALCLRRQVGVKSESLSLLDPCRPLEVWSRRTESCGMRYLRSPSVHHLGPGSSDLVRFQKQRYRTGKPWRGKSNSPKLDLFNAHSGHLVEESGLQKAWIPAKVKRLVRNGSGFSLETNQGDFLAGRVVLALGPCWLKKLPSWLEPGRRLVQYILNPSFSTDCLGAGKRLAVVGGGMTSVQAALKLSEQHRVTLLTRSELQVHEFDVASGWMGPMNGRFARLPNQERRALVDSKKRGGTINSSVYRSFRKALEEGRLHHELLNEPDCSPRGEALVVHNGGESMLFDQVLLGTGFGPIVHPLHRQIAEELGAPLSHCGTPVLDHYLQWLPGLFVMGCQAELQLGPAAGNILGGRLGSQRLLSFCRMRELGVENGHRHGEVRTRPSSSNSRVTNVASLRA